MQKGVIVKERCNEVKKTKYSWNKALKQNQHTATYVEQLNGSRAAAAVSSSEQSDRKKRRFSQLDEEINQLISDKKLHVSLSPNRIRNEAELDKAMKRVADMLVAAGVGYVGEAELMVTKQGRRAFVRTDPEVVIHSAKLRRCALSGDIVRVFIFKEAIPVALVEVISQQLSGGEESDGEGEVVTEELAKATVTGFVVKILSQVHERTCVGQFGQFGTHKSKNLVFFPHERGIPPVNVAGRFLDKYIPQDTSAEQYFKELPNRLFEVELTSCNSFYGVYTGRVLSDVGTKGNIRDENACILLKHGFQKHYIDRLQTMGQPVAEQDIRQEVELGQRRDLTDMCIFTIDPATARDLDDAVSCRQLENGNIEVGIHISDVTHYVLEESDLDHLVRQAKTTSVYMVDQVYHMLPTNLCQTCSLLPGEDKRAVSVFVEMTPEAEVVATSFTRSVINSCCQLSYEHAQKIIDDEDPLSVAPLTIYNDYSAADLRTTIKALHRLSRIMRAERKRNGALNFDKPKYYFRLDADNQPTELLSEMSKPANHLIEEFMILANQVVGKFIYDEFPDWAILRQHSPPKLPQMSVVKAFFRKMDFPELNYNTAQEINASMAAILAESDRRGLDRKGFEPVLNSLLAKPMNRAQYFCAGEEKYADRFDHFALSIPFYTHFTSPIRRYPDIMVHRLLIRAITGQSAPKSWLLDEIAGLMGKCNRQKMNARYAGEDSAQLFLMHYLRRHFPEGREMKGTVCSILTHSVEVKLWETGDELIVTDATLQASGWEVKRRVDSVTVRAVGGEGEATKEVILSIFGTCLVRVSVDKERLKAALVL